MKDATNLLEDLEDAYNSEAMRAEEHREKAKTIDERAKSFRDNNSAADPSWLNDKVREMRSDFDAHVAECKISERRANLFEQGYCPAGRDETGDQEFMQRHGDLYARCNARNRLRDSGEPLRHHRSIADEIRETSNRKDETA
jgi:hypothetical protein